MSQVAALFQTEPNPTPCMAAFSQWWLEHGKKYPGISVQDAWWIFMHGYWAGEESKS